MRNLFQRWIRKKDPYSYPTSLGILKEILDKRAGFFVHKLQHPTQLWLGQKAWIQLRDQERKAFEIMSTADPQWLKFIDAESVPKNVKIFGMELQSSETDDNHVSVH